MITTANQPIKGVLIRADKAQQSEIKPANGTDYSLDELQTYVGGYIETIALAGGLVLVVNENGKLLNLPKNDIATTMARVIGRIAQHDYIVGDVVLTDWAYID